MNRNFVCLLATLALVACSSGGGGGGGGAPAPLVTNGDVAIYSVPDSLDQNAPAKGDQVSADQLTDLRTSLDGMNLLGATDLVYSRSTGFSFGSTHGSYASANSATTDQVTLAQQMRENCTVVQPNARTQDPAEPTVGSQTITTDSRSISGANCPIDDGSSSQSVITLTKIDQRAKVVDATMTVTGDAHLQVKDVSLIQKTNVLGSKMNMLGAGLIHIDEKNGSLVYLKMKGSETFQFNSGSTLGVDFSIEALGTGITGSSNLEPSQMTAVFAIHFGGGTYTVREDVRENGTKSFYLNGWPTSEDQIQQIFGRSVSNP